MPKGVEHRTARPRKVMNEEVVRTAVMPKGVEHILLTILTHHDLPRVRTAVMPKGVEHDKARLNNRSAEVSGENRCDAERR